MKPRIRILPDGFLSEPHWCGLFAGGYSSIGRVAAMSLQAAIAFYARVLRADGVIGR